MIPKYLMEFDFCWGGLANIVPYTGFEQGWKTNDFKWDFLLSLKVESFILLPLLEIGKGGRIVCGNYDHLNDPEYNMTVQVRGFRPYLMEGHQNQKGQNPGHWQKVYPREYKVNRKKRQKERKKEKRGENEKMRNTLEKYGKHFVDKGTHYGLKGVDGD